MWMRMRNMSDLMKLAVNFMFRLLCMYVIIMIVFMWNKIIIKLIYNFHFIHFMP